MPYVNIRITREPGTTENQKADLIKRVTDVLVSVLGKDPATTFVVLDEVETSNWGIGGLPVGQFRRNHSATTGWTTPESGTEEPL